MKNAALDGNVAAGVLANIFQAEMTSAASSCAHCGAVRQLGELVAYVHAPGVVLRCSSCDAVLLRVMHNSGRAWLDLRGMSVLRIDLTDESVATDQQSHEMLGQRTTFLRDDLATKPNGD